jgi:DNA-binding CsgD family transcriptional regulator
MSNKEFYITPKGGVKITDEHGTHELKPENRGFIIAMIEKIGEFWPLALEAASTAYSKYRHNISYFEFLIVRRFLKCNFGKYDSTLDIDQFGNFHFEEVECPLRGECSHEGVICKPKFNSKLSEREIEIMQLLYEGCIDESIAEKLSISIETIKTHKRNAFRRTGVHSLSEFFLYVKNNKIFN